MKRPAHLPLITAFAAALLGFAAVAAKSSAAPPSRPRIIGIASVVILTTDLAAADSFYRQATSPHTVCKDCKRALTRFFGLPSGQTIELREDSAPPSNLLFEIAFVTDDLGKLRKYVETKGVKVEQRQSKTTPLKGIIVRDPEGHQVAFVESPYIASASSSSLDAGTTDPLRIVHAGFVVQDRAATDHFYKDILGFHLYWHGGMKDDVDNWVAMQVPDGTDWIEYMLGVAPDANKHTRGVMNHIALGVMDIHETQEKLIAAGQKFTEEPKVGRDGKWQLNLYDPDETRTEFMEFTPKEKPCCSEFTGTHPGPK
jgi:catechol 2,3-dioxygenase-like lactoylglutathione lyase family enzyme